MVTTQTSPRLVELAEMARAALSRNGPHDVLQFMFKMLSEGRIASINGNIEEALCRHGQPYTRELPAKIRRGPMKQCFANAFRYADIGEGIYVEGFALHHEMGLVHHAWITRDGRGAVEVTWKKATEARYYGIPVSHELRNRLVTRTERPGLFGYEQALPFKEILSHLRAQKLPFEGQEMGPDL